MLLTWDDPTERYYHTGCDRGVIYPPGQDPVVWNGLIGLDESSDMTKSILYQGGNVYMADVEPGDFEARVSAFFFPDVVSDLLGQVPASPGFIVDNQKPKQFGFSYRSLVGSGTSGDMFGYQIHLVYNAVASISTRSRKTLTSQSELAQFDFDLVCTPIKLHGFRPSAHYILDTRFMSPETVTALEDILYGGYQDVITEPIEAGFLVPYPGRLPTPTELYDLLEFGDTITFTDHGDGTWTARGSSTNIIKTSPTTWEIKNVNGTDNGDGTYLLQDTP